MSGIKILKEEKGFALLNTLFFMMFLGLIGISVTTMVVADAKMQNINLSRPQALYAAQSGMDYAIRGVMEFARTHSSLAGLNYYTETIPAGNGLTADITLKTVGTDSLTIISVGKTQNFSQTITKGLNYVDVSKYAVYASGNVSHVTVAGSVKKNAQFMPLFDLDELRDIAKPYHYFNGNLTINSPFTFNHSIAFAEGNITFKNWNIINFGSFVSGRNINLNTNFISMFWGNMYLPTHGSSFNALNKYRIYLLTGGIIANGDVIGTRYKVWFWWMNNLNILHSRSRMNAFLKYSVNGGPLVIKNSHWKTAH